MTILKEGQKSSRLHFVLRSEDCAKVQELARRDDRSICAIVRIALMKYLNDRYKSDIVCSNEPVVSKS